MKAFPRTLIVSVMSAAMLLAACGGESTEDLLTSARAYLAKSDSKAAVIQLKNVLQRKPDSAEARFLLGKALLGIGDAASASLELRKALELKHPATQVVPELARSLLAQRQYQKLVEQFGEVDLAEPAAAADLKTSVATAYAALANSDKAQAAVSAALRVVPDNPATLMLQARLAAGERKFDEASALIEKVIAASPTDPQAWHHKGEFLFLGKGDIAGAADAYRKALSIQPDHVAARSNLITLLLAQRDLKGAAEQVGELRKTLPNNPQTVFFEAQLAFANQNPKKALELIQQVLKVAPENVQVLQLAGAVEFSNGSLLEAERSLIKALSLSPSLPVARRQLAQTYIRLGQPAKALTTLQPLLAKPDAGAQTHSLAAEAYLLSGDVGQAEASYARAVKLNPKNIKSRTALALTKLKAGGVDATVAELQSIASTDKGTHADMALVSMYIRSKDFTRALKAIDAIEAKQPDKPIAANLRGRVQLLNKNVAEARRSFERALAIDPVYIPAAASLAALDLTDKKPDAAKKRFEAVLAIDPKNLQALLAITEMRAREGGSKEEIAALLINAVKLNPTERAPRLLVINHYLHHQDVKAALTAAQDALAALPNSSELLDAVGRAQMAAGDTNQAITAFNKLAGLDPQSPQAHMRLSGVHLTAKNTPAAEQSLRRALAITPDFLPAQQALIDIALAENRPQDALLVARTVQKQRPGAVVGFMMEGAVEVSRKNFAGAADTYRTALKKFPLTDPAAKLHSALLASGKESEADKLAATWTAGHPKDVQFLAYLGEMALAQSNFEAAEAHFRSVIAIRPDTAVALNNLAWIMAKLGKPGAVAYAEKADILQPNTPALMDTLATVLAADKQIDKALEIQKKALAFAPNSPALQLNLARLHIQAGDKVAARAALETLAKLGDKFAGQTEVSQLLKTL